MGDLKGIYFYNGLQAVGLVEKKGDFYHVSSMLQVVIQQGQNGLVLSFDHVAPCSDHSVAGIDVEIHTSSCFIYDVRDDIRDGYYQSTSRIQPISAFKV